MDRDPEVALVALVLMLVVGSAAVVVAALRADRNGARPARTAPFRAGAVGEGGWTVVLEGVGAKKIQVVKELRAITGLGVAEAKNLAEGSPATILSGVDHATATAAHGRLIGAGAAARITEA